MTDNPKLDLLYPMNEINDLQSVYNVSRKAPFDADIHEAVKASAERVAKALVELESYRIEPNKDSPVLPDNVESIDSK